MPRAKSIEKEITELREQLLDHDHRYHVLNQPVITDTEYDDLFRRLRDLEEKDLI